MNLVVVTPWHNPTQLNAFLRAWCIPSNHPQLMLVQDTTKQGCAKTKNQGIQQAIRSNKDVVIILDDDCFPAEGTTFEQFITAHLAALEPQPVEMFRTVTQPPSRGTPYFNRTVVMPVAASMGFWLDVGDYDAPGQLVYGARTPMSFDKRPIFGSFFPLCGMNLAFRTSEWPWCQFVDVPRFDDIWQGFLWQRRAYADGKCFNLNGPLVRHVRQSNVWANLRDETPNLERNETLWQEIVQARLGTYEELRAAVGL